MNPFRVSVYWILPLTLLCAVPYSSPFLSYVWNHPQTLTVRCGRALAGHALDFGFVSILFLGFYHWGRVFLNQFFPLPSRNLTPPEKFLFSAFIGESLIAYVLLTLGLLHAFHSLSFWFLFLFLFYGAGRECKKTITTFFQIKELNALKIPFPALVLLILLGLAAIRSLITTCAPPTDWDTLVYHLAFPKIFLGNGQLLRLPWAINAHYPLNTEMIYTLALAIQGELAAHWINFWHGGLLLATTACLLRRYFGKEAILLALATFALQPIFQRVIGNASTDFPIAWAGLISFFCFFRAQETLQENTVSQETARPWYLLTGLCCGLAMGYKLTGTWIAATVSILILSSKFQRPFFLWTLLGIVLGGFPWYLRNLILTGNPIWPYLSGLFPATNLEKEAWLRIKVSVTEGIEKNLGNWFSLPIQILLRPAQFLYASHYLLLPFYGLLFWKCARPEPFRKIEKQMFLLLLVFSSLWFWTYQNWRYFLPAAGLIVVLTSAWTQELMREKGRWKMIAWVILFAWIPVLHLSWSNELFPFLDVRSAQFPDRPAKERYLELTLGAPYLLCQVANQTLPKDAKVFFFRDFRGYYLDRDYAWGDPLNPGLFSYSSIKERSALLKELKNFGFTHILYNPTIGHYQGDAAYYERSNQRMQELLTHDAELLFTGGELRLFRINYSKPEAPPTNPSFR